MVFPVSHWWKCHPTGTWQYRHHFETFWECMIDIHTYVCWLERFISSYVHYYPLCKQSIDGLYQINTKLQSRMNKTCKSSSFTWILCRKNVCLTLICFCGVHADPRQIKIVGISQQGRATGFKATTGGLWSSNRHTNRMTDKRTGAWSACFAFDN